jgi:hypothetical protein
MDLREAIRTIIREVASEEIRKIVREVLIEELVPENPRKAAAQKAAATRAANRVAAPATAPRTKVPAKAREFGVFLGQQYRGKKGYPKIHHRTIEVVRLDETGIWPKIIGSAGKNVKAKHIAYETLQSKYDRVH